MQNLSRQIPIVNQDGTPTEYFMRLLQGRGGLLEDAGDQIDRLDSEVTALLSRQIIAGDGLDGGGPLSANVTLTADVQEILDQVSITQGHVLYRAATGWAALPPGTAGNVLTTNGAGADPAWGAVVAPSADIQALLDIISSTRGTVLYRGASGWAALAPGTAGHFLKTNGSGADPAWAAQATANIQTLLDGISSTRGTVLYRGASGWAALAPGTSGHVLQTNGSGADPAWAAPSSSANIQTLLDGISSTRGTVLYRGASGWAALAPGTSGHVLQTNGAGADPAWVAPSSSANIQTLLDGISSTRGTVLYRGASGWAALAPGTSGHVLQTNGSGADPAWAAPSGSANIQTLLDGISSTRGTVLFRGSTAWQALSPGTAGYVLQTKGAGLDPAWEPDAYGASGGGTRPSVVQSASSAGNSGSVTFSVAPTPGNLLVCVGTHYNNISATGVSAGWTIMNNRNGSSTDGNFIGTKIATSADTATISVYGSVAGCCMTIFEIQNSSGVMFLPWNDIQEQTGLTTTTLNMGIPRDNCLLVGAFATVSANSAPTGITGATAGTTVTGTSTSASPRQVTPFTNNAVSKGAANVVATYAASPRSYGFGVVVLPI